jgi:hypothetical protein
MSILTDEITRRRTFAMISHPDAGKTTLTRNCCCLAGDPAGGRSQGAGATGGGCARIGWRSSASAKEAAGGKVRHRNHEHEWVVGARYGSFTPAKATVRGLK